MSVRMLRVLHVFGRLLRGGAELRTVELAESFQGERVQSDFLVLSGLDGPLDERVRAAGGDVIKCRLDAGFPRASTGCCESGSTTSSTRTFTTSR